MNEEIRKKYERLLTPPDGKKRVGEMTEKELLLGRILKNIRERRKISQGDLTEGICPISVLANIESGTKVNLLLTNALLTRMGKSAEKFEFYFTIQEYAQQHEREAIIDLWKNGNLENAEEKLAQYEKEYDTKVNERWSCWQRYSIQLRRDLPPDDFENQWQLMKQRKLYCTQEEWDFLWEAVNFYERKGQKEKAREIYALMYRDCTDDTKPSDPDGHGMDEERKLELLPLLCWKYGQFERLEGNLEAAEGILNTGIALLKRNMRLYYLREMLEERLQIYYQRWQESKAEEMYQKVGQDAQYLVVLDFAYKEKEKGFRRIEWMKEELKWESTALDNLSIGPEKLWD